MVLPALLSSRQALHPCLRPLGQRLDNHSQARAFVARRRFRNYTDSALPCAEPGLQIIEEHAA